MISAFNLCLDQLERFLVLIVWGIGLLVQIALLFVLKYCVSCIYTL